MAAPTGTFIITGANGGLGAATVSRFLSSPETENCKGLFTVRNPATAHAAKKVLNASPYPGRHEIFPLDISTLSGVRTGAEIINRRVAQGVLPPVRALVLNAAVQDGAGQRFTGDGLETHFGVNYLANFLLVLLLLQSMDKEQGRIVLVSSWSHDPLDSRNAIFMKSEEHKTAWREPEKMAHEKVVDEKEDEYPAGYRRYGRSKTLLVMFMYELQRRLSASSSLSNICVLAVDPGGMPNTSLLGDLAAHSWIMHFGFQYIMGALIGFISWLNPDGSYRSTWTSAGALLNASFNEKDLGKHPQALYLDGSREAQAGKEAMNEQKQRELWEASLEMAGIKEGDTMLEKWQ